MSNESNDGKVNPYEPPRSLIKQECDRAAEAHVMEVEIQLLELLNELDKLPILFAAWVDQYVDSGEPQSTLPRQPQSFRLTSLMFVFGAFGIGLVLVPVAPLLGISLCAAVAVVLIAIARLSNPIPRWRRSQPIKMPAGEYSWLITPGGILITTPGRAQWAMPWSLVDRIYCDASTWKCQFLHDQSPPWRMPLTAISDENGMRFQQVVSSVRGLASARRPHPVCYAEKVEWSAKMVLMSGVAWSILIDGPRVWCDVRGMVCSLPEAVVQQTANSVSLCDVETDWMIDLPLAMATTVNSNGG